MGYTLMAIPNDPIYKYYDKGEIKTRYWNPCDIFDEIHIISLSDYDIDPYYMKTVFGNAKAYVHTIGKPKLYNYLLWANKVKKIAQKIQPDVIRVHNSQLGGWLGVRVARELGIPSLMSLHASYDEARAFYKRRGDTKNYYKQRYLGRFVEPYALTNATAISYVYPNIHPYLERSKRRDAELIYNRVYVDNFSQKSDYSLNSLEILTIGRLNEHKNIDILIKSIHRTKYHLTIIGKGEEEERLHALAKELGVENQITFIGSVPNDKIKEYYLKSDVFAMAMEAEGISIPVIEAMASGLPVVVPKSIEGELKADFLYVERNPESYQDAYRLLENIEERKRQGIANYDNFLNIQGIKMEEKEAKLYVRIISKTIKR